MKKLIIILSALLIVSLVTAITVTEIIRNKEYNIILSDGRQASLSNITREGGVVNYELTVPDGRGLKIQDIKSIDDFVQTLGYVSINTTILPSVYLGYNYGMVSPNYQIYFLSNTNLNQPLRFEKLGYYFVYDISQGEMMWIGRPGQPDATTTLGSGASSNSLDTVAVVADNKIIYQNAFYNTNLTYELESDMVKEKFILSGLPSIKDYYYLQYSGNIRFNATLSICTETTCYIPSGTQDDFETSDNIYFKNSLNDTIFYLKKPIIKDSAGKTINGVYSVHGSNAQMNFWLRINQTFLANATYPIFIDPTTAIYDAQLNPKPEKTVIRIK